MAEISRSAHRRVFEARVLYELKNTGTAPRHLTRPLTRCRLPDARPAAPAARPRSAGAAEAPAAGVTAAPRGGGAKNRGRVRGVEGAAVAGWWFVMVLMTVCCCEPVVVCLCHVCGGRHMGSNI